MANTTNDIKHVTSPLARQTLLDSKLTDPVAGKRPIRQVRQLQAIRLHDARVGDPRPGGTAPINRSRAMPPALPAA